MSSQRIGENTPETSERRIGPVTTRQASAEELLAEFKQLLESAGYPPSCPPASPPPSESLASASGSTAELRKSTNVGTAQDRAGDSSVDGSRKRGPAGCVDSHGGQQDDPGEAATRLRSRSWKLVASGLAFGVVALVCADLAFTHSAPAPRGPRSDAPVQRQSGVRPPVVTSGDVNSPSAKDDSPHPDHAQAGRSDGESDVGQPTPKAPIDDQRPTDGANAMAGATATETPGQATAATGASTASQATSPEPAQRDSVRPDRTPTETDPSNPALPTSPGEAPKPTDKATTAAEVRVESARPAAAKVGSAIASSRKIIAKPGKASSGPTAEPPYPPPRPVQPEKAGKAMVSPTAQAVADPAAAAPTAPTPPTQPTSFAAQSVGQLTNAFVYLTRLPGALIEHVTSPSAEGR